MAGGSWWFAPEPAELSGSRLILDLGLRSTDQRLRELVVPGIGRVWFVRQLSWSVAAILLRDELCAERDSSIRATTISHALEALGCKLEFRENADGDRILGKRAFGRDIEDSHWSFSDLTKRRHYVQNTYRQMTSRTLLGLGLATGSRYERFELTEIGRELAEAFLRQEVGQGEAPLRKRITSWINDEAIDYRSMRKALSPNHPGADESDVVWRRLIGLDTPESKTRERLCRAFRDRKTTPDVDDIRTVIVSRLTGDVGARQATDIKTALVFGGMVAAVRGLLVAITTVLAERGQATVADLIRPSRRDLHEVRQRGDHVERQARLASFKDDKLIQFLGEIAPTADDRTCLRHLVSRAQDLLILDGDLVRKGPLFRRLGQDDDEANVKEQPREPSGNTFRIGNLHSLWRDCDNAGFP